MNRLSEFHLARYRKLLAEAKDEPKRLALFQFIADERAYERRRLEALSALIPAEVILLARSAPNPSPDI